MVVVALEEEVRPVLQGRTRHWLIAALWRGGSSSTVAPDVLPVVKYT